MNFIKSNEDRAALIMILNDGTAVDSAFYNGIKNHVLSRLPTLAAGTPRTLKQICEPNFWHLLSNGERRTAGIAISHMAANNEVPLTVVQQKHEYPKKYARI